MRRKPDGKTSLEVKAAKAERKEVALLRQRLLKIPEEVVCLRGRAIRSARMSIFGHSLTQWYVLGSMKGGCE